MTKPTRSAGNLSLTEAITLTRAHIQTLKLTEATVYEWNLNIDRLQRFCETLDIRHIAQLDETTAERFIWAPTKTGSAPSKSTAKNRRTALRIVFRALRAHDYDAPDRTPDVVIPTQPVGTMRPLIDKEILRCEQITRTPRPTLFSAVLALAEAGASTWEMGGVETQHVELPQGTVLLPGNDHTRSRVAPLTEFGIRTLTARLEHTTGLVCFNTASSRRAAAANASRTLDKILRRAQLAHLPGVRADSIRAWAARRVYDNQGAEAAADFLGLRSLDAAIRIVGVTR